jgi:hypothetical protein
VTTTLIVVANEAVISYGDSKTMLGGLNFFAPLITKECGNGEVTYEWKDDPLGNDFMSKID